MKTENTMRLYFVVLVLALQLISYGATAQTNDVCGGAIPIQLGASGATRSYSGSNVGAGIDTPPQNQACGPVTYDSPGVWYSYTATTTGTVEVSTCNEETNLDTQLTVFRGGCNSLECIGHNEDRSFFLFCSDVTFEAVAGTTYYILVHGTLGDEDVFQLDIKGITKPDNDECGGAFPITLGQSVSGSTVNATIDDPTGKCADPATYDTEGVWYRFQSTTTITISASTCFQPDTNFDTQLSIFGGGCSSLTCIAYNDEAPGNAECSGLSFPATAGQTYYIFLHGYDGARGAFELLLSLPPGTPTSTPTRQPTPSPTPTPPVIGTPTLVPTAIPTNAPTTAPTPSPTSVTLTNTPTAASTPRPTAGSTTNSQPPNSNVQPSAPPTTVPTISPTIGPTPIPTSLLTSSPTIPTTPVPTAEAGTPTSFPMPSSSEPPTSLPTPMPTNLEIDTTGSPTPSDTGSSAPSMSAFFGIVGALIYALV